MMMARKSDFMKWVDHQVETDADLRRKVEEYLNEMMIEQKLAALRTERGMDPGATRRAARRESVSHRQPGGRTCKEHRAAHALSLGDGTRGQAHG